MRRLALLLTLVLLAATAVVLVILTHRTTAPSASPPPATVPPVTPTRPITRRHGCVAVPSACGYPDATTTGATGTLRNVPGQLTSGPGWTYNSAAAELDVTGAGATLTGLNITGNLNITASNVTISNDQVTDNGGSFAVSLRHVTGTTIRNSTITGANPTTGRVGSAIDDIYGDSTATTITGTSITAFKTAIQITAGTIAGNYIHDPGYQAGDHVNGILDVGTTQNLAITGNTILNTLTQTDAISLDASTTGQVISNKSITGNLLGGGGYAIYGGTTLSNTTTNITIRNNDFSQATFPRSGQYGPIAYYSTTSPGNTWTGNTWDTTGQTIPPPSGMQGGPPESRHTEDTAHGKTRR